MAQSIRVYSKGEPRNPWICAPVQKRRARAVRSSCCHIAYSGRSVGNCADLGLFKRMACRVVGADHRTSRRYSLKQRRETGKGEISRFFKSFARFANDVSGDAVVEATILFPIMIMIFAALVLLAMYLPSQSVLQRATQYAAIAIATENSDTWLFFNESDMTYYWETDIGNLPNVYTGLFSSSCDVQTKGEDITVYIENLGINIKAGQLSVVCSENNMLHYKEIIVTASRDYPMPVDLSFIGFPKTITVSATSTVVVQNANEFVRNIDMACDFAYYISDKYGLGDVGATVSSFGNKVKSLLGW